MADFIDTLFGSGAGDFWRGQIPMIVIFTLIPIIRLVIKPPAMMNRQVLLRCITGSGIPSRHLLSAS